MQNLIVFFFVILLINTFSLTNFAQANLNSNLLFENSSESIEPQLAVDSLERVELNEDGTLDKKISNKFNIVYSQTIKSFDKLIVYDDVLISKSKDILYLYDKDLNINWQMSLVTHNFKQLYPEFDTIYSINQDDLLTTFSINSGIKQTMDSVNLESFVIKYPFLLASFKNKIKMIDLNSKDVLWEKNINCEEKIIFSSSKITGCLNKNKLTIYDSISGDKLSRLVDSKLKNATYLSSTNYYAFFQTYNGGVLSLDFDESKVVSTSYNIQDNSFLLRQKELIQVTNNKKIQCVDLNSKKIKWEKEFNSPITDVVANQNYLLIKFPSQNIRIIDNFNGKNIYSFSTKDELAKIDQFYKYKKKWYLINNKSNDIISVK